MRPGGDIMTFIFTTMCMGASKHKEPWHVGVCSRPGTLGRVAVYAFKSAIMPVERSAALRHRRKDLNDWRHVPSRNTGD
jgi:hypothetical protein